MDQDKLITSHFEKALLSLEAVLLMPPDPVVRDASIKRFEYTYELAWKMIRRHLIWRGDIDVEALSSRRELFREAARVRLIADAELWFDIHSARNRTSQAYDEEKAAEVYEIVKAFAVEARRLLGELKKHND